MNFEKFYRLVCSNWFLLPNKKQTLLFLCYHYDLLIWKRKKLKLGAIVFIIKEYKFDDFLLWEEAEIKFINQDTTIDDERKIETIFKKLGWEWNARNYFALSVVISTMFFKSYIFMLSLYKKHFFTLAFRDVNYDFILRYGVEEAYNYHAVGFFKNLFKINYWLIEIITSFCSFHNLIL